MKSLTLCSLALFALAEAAALPEESERHLQKVRQLTTFGSNAEAYWGPDGKQIVFQSTREGHPCDQLYIMKADGSGQRRVFNGQGRVTCGWILPGGRLMYASTYLASPDCPEAPPFTPGTYRWPVFPGYDLLTCKLDGTDPQPLVPAPGCDAEATASPNEKWIVFTSERSGDIDIWKMRTGSTNVRSLICPGRLSRPSSPRMARASSSPPIIMTTRAKGAYWTSSASTSMGRAWSGSRPRAPSTPFRTSARTGKNSSGSVVGS